MTSGSIARRLVLAVLLASLAQAALADDGTCTFKVAGQDVIAGPCKITDLDGTGSLTIASPDDAVAARIVTDGSGVGKAYWNGGGSAAGTEVELGTVVLLGACWAGDKTKLCTTR